MSSHELNDDDPATHLTINTHLVAGGRYLVSANGAFFGILQSDGNFCVYRGSGPADNHGLLWQTQTHVDGPCHAIMHELGMFCIFEGTGPENAKRMVWGSPPLPFLKRGAHIAVLQDDGNFCVYQGVAPDHQGSLVWQTGTIDPVEVVTAGSPVYDLDHVEEQNGVIVKQESIRYANPGTEAATYNFEMSVTKTFTTGWSETSSWKVKVESTIKTGVPILADGKIKIEAEAGKTYVKNGTETLTESSKLTAPVKVPAGVASVVTFTMKKSCLLVPYRLDGVVILRSGAEVPIHARGTYRLADAYETSIVQTFPGTDVPSKSVVAMITHEPASHVDGTEAVLA